MRISLVLPALVASVVTSAAVADAQIFYNYQPIPEQRVPAPVLADFHKAVLVKGEDAYLQCGPALYGQLSEYKRKVGWQYASLPASTTDHLNGIGPHTYYAISYAFSRMYNAGTKQWTPWLDAGPPVFYEKRSTLNGKPTSVSTLTGPPPCNAPATAPD